MSKKLVKNNNLDTDIKMFIADSVKETLEDPDFGLELSDYTKKRLQKTKKSKKTVSFSEVKKKLEK